MTHGDGSVQAHVAGSTDEADRHRMKRLRARAVFVLGLGLAAACLYLTFRNADLSRTWTAVARLGPAVLVAFLPYGVSLALDGLAWSRLLAMLGRSVDAMKLLCLRAAAEALLLSLPAGALLAETIKPVLLRSHHGVPLTEGVSVIAVRKVLIILGHGLYLCVGLMLGTGLLMGPSAQAIGGRALPWLMGGMAVALVSIALVSGGVMAGGLAGRLGRWIQRLPFRSMQRWVEQKRADFERTDGTLGRVLVPHRLVSSAGLYVGMWLAESVEAYLLLRLLGFDVSFGDAVALEALMSVLRALVFFIPAGLGVQDAGYAAFLSGVGGADALSSVAAFVLLKRAREVCWMGVGYILLLQARLTSAGGTPVLPFRLQESQPPSGVTSDL